MHLFQKNAGLDLHFFFEKMQKAKKYGSRQIDPVHPRAQGDSIRIPLLRCPSDKILKIDIVHFFRKNVHDRTFFSKKIYKAYIFFEKMYD